MFIFIFFISMFHFTLSIIYSLKKKDYLNPLLLFLSPLFAQYVIYYFLYRQDYVVSNLTLTIYSCGIFSFTIGFFILELTKTKKSYRITEVKYRTNWLFLYLCLVLGILFLLKSRNYLNSLNVGSYDLGSNAANLREAFVYSLADIPFYVTYGKYFLLFSISVIFYEYVNKKKKIHPIAMFILLIILVVNAFSVMSRTDLLITLMPLLIIWSRSEKLNDFRMEKKRVVRRKSPFKKKMMVASAVVVLLFLMNNMRTIGQKTSFFDKQNVFMQYLGKPLISFDQWILPHSNESSEILILEPVNKLLLKLGVINPDTIRLAPLGQFNVYSYLRVPYMEFGIIGVILIMFMVGMLASFIYHKSKTGNRNWLLFYSFYSYALVMAFFDWQFGVMTYVYLIIFLFIVSIRNTTIKKEVVNGGKE